MRRQAAVRAAGPQRDDDSPAFSSSGSTSLEPVGRRIPRGAALLLGAGALLVLLAAIKPWGDAPAPSSSGSVVGDWIDSALPDPTPPPSIAPLFSPPPLAEADLAAAELCRWPSGWRVFAHQEWLGSLARVWTAVEPVHASEPGDPRIPLVRLRSRWVPLLGFCAPVAPSGSAAAAASRPLIRAWRVTDDARPEPIRLALVDPPSPSTLGSLWAPLVGERRLTTWPPGRYVFRMGGPDALGSDAAAWWAVEVGPPG
jgi:hypothetical protein